MEHLRKLLPTLTGKEKNIGFAYLVFQFAFLPGLLQLLGAMFSLDNNVALLNFLYFSINFICVIFIFSKYLKKSILRVRRAPRETVITALLGFAVYWLCISCISALNRTFFPGYVNLNDHQVIAVFADHPILMFLGTVILAPVAEEVLHRGLVFGTLFQKNIALAYGLSALLFSSIHVAQYVGVYQPGYVILALVQYLPAGLIFAWAYQKSGSIAAPLLIHAANNFLAVITMR
jgi:membrane protease YdiL (CAAX protease family)